MKIRQLKIKNYKRFSDNTFNLTPGLNIVYAENEAGKSTLTQAIMDLLYRDPATKSQGYLNSVKSWGSGVLPLLSMTFHAKESRFELVKDFNEKSIKLINLDTKRELNTLKEVAQAMKSITGIPTEEIYRKTAFINQGQVAFADSSDDLLHEVTDISGNGGENVNRIIKKLQSELALLNKGLEHLASNPGPLKLQQDKIAQLEKYLQEKKEIWGKRQLATDKKESSGDELKGIKEKISELEELMNNYKIAKDARLRLEELNTQISEVESKLQEVGKMEKYIQSLNGELLKYPMYQSDQIEADLREIIEAEQGIKLASKELEALKKSKVVEQHSIEQKDEIEHPANYGVIRYLLIIVVAIPIALLGYYFSKGVLIPIVIVAMALFAIALMARRPLRMPKVDPTLPTDNPVQPSAEEQLVTNMNERLNGSQKQLDKILAKYDAKDIADFYSKKANFMALKSELEDKVRTRDIALGGKTIEFYNNSQKGLFIAKKEIETNVLTEKVANAVLTPEQYLQKGRELDKLIIKKRKVEEEVIVSKTRMADSGVNYGEIVALEEDLENAKLLLKDLFKKQKVLSLVITGLNESIVETSKSSNKLISNIIQNNLSLLTNSRYKDVKINKDLSIQVFSNEKEDWVDPIVELSSGTRDQIYFLCRLGFLKLITGDKSVPLILDDPFVTADLRRRDNFRELLKGLSTSSQILLFTNDNYYLDWGDPVPLSLLNK